MNDEEPLPPTPAAGKRPYAPPAVSRVELRPDEAVLGNCKSASRGAGPGGPTCARTPLPPCSIAGS
jgi:hypothetical protein